MIGELALQISQDEQLGKYIVISASHLSLDELLFYGRMLGVVE